MGGIGESSSPLPKVADEKPMIVRVKRKASQARLDALWLEINDRPLKRPLLDFQNLSISDESSKKEEFKAKKIFVQHVETLRNSEATIDIVHSLVAPDAAGIVLDDKKNEERKRNFKRETSRQDQLLVKARQEQEVLAKNARFEQIWRSRKGIKDATHDQLHDMYQIYDIVRVDTSEATQDHMSLEDQCLLSSYLPLLREFLPNAADEVESDLDASLIKQELPIDDYVYDYYTVKNDAEITDDASNPFPLVQVNDLDLYDGPDDSDYESDDSNAENNPQFDYPDESSDELGSEEGSNDESEDNKDDSDKEQSSESSDVEQDDSSEEGAQMYEDELYGDFDDDGDGDSDDGNDKGEDWRWSYR